MESISEWWKSHKEKKEERRKSTLVERANELFDLSVYNSELWLTYDGHVVCPCSLLSQEAAAAVITLRNMYVKNNLEHTKNLSRK